MKSYERLLILVPPRAALLGAGARLQFSTQTALPFVALGPGRREQGSAPAALLPKAARVELYFDAADVLLTPVEAPKLAEGKLRLALPHLLEERLLGAASDAHFAFIRGGDNRLTVAVIDRAFLTRTLQVLHEAGVQPRLAASALYLLPPPRPGETTLAVEDGRGRARWGRHEGMAFDFDGNTVPAALLLALRQSPARRVQAGGAQAAALAALLAPLEVSTHIDRDAGAAAPAAADDAIDLLQGSFAPSGWLARVAGGRSALLSGRALAAWAVAAAAAFIIGLNVYWLKLEGEARALREQSLAAFRGAFPSFTSAPDDVGLLMRHTRRELDGLRARAGQSAPADFTVLNGQAAQLLAAAPVGSVAGLEYRDGALRVRFKPGQQPDATLQDRLRSAAAQQQLNLRWEADGSARLAPAE
jgi:general secretion pathway protein L